MAVNNPYAFGALGGLNSPLGGSVSGAGTNPYAGIIGYLSDQRAKTEKSTYADAMTKLREMIAGMPQLPQRGAQAPALGGPAQGPVLDVDTVYAPDAYMKGVGGIESSNNYGAVNDKTGAGGKYQFIQRTWDDLGKQQPDLGLTAEGRMGTAPEHQQQQEAAMRALTAQNAPMLKSTLGRAPTHAELYLAHFFGPGYASSVLKNLNTPVDALVPESFIKANPTIKGVDGATLLKMYGAKFNPLGRTGER